MGFITLSLVQELNVDFPGKESHPKKKQPPYHFYMKTKITRNKSKQKPTKSKQYGVLVHLPVTSPFMIRK